MSILRSTLHAMLKHQLAPMLFWLVMLPGGIWLIGSWAVAWPIFLGMLIGYWVAWTSAQNAPYWHKKYDSHPTMPF